jgi:dTDP-4-dehydrorhamnose reductase
MSNRLLVIGGSGLVGSTLIKYSLKNYEVYATYNKNSEIVPNIFSTKVELPLQTNDLIKLIKKIKPTFTIHTVAYPSVDFCETNQKEATSLHVNVVKEVTKACKEENSKLVFLSTDAVFEGKLNKKYTESDEPKPINHYGVTKLQAEKIVTSVSSNVVLRTAVIYGWHIKSRFTAWILENLMQNKMVDPYIDQYNTPTLVNDLATAILKILEMNVSGLYHSTGKSCINRYDFACLLAKTFGLDQNLIKPVTKEEKKQDAPRPISTCLDSQKLEKTINFEFSDIYKGVSFLHQQYKTILNGQR